jgi:hypothetical protein
LVSTASAKKYVPVDNAQIIAVGDPKVGDPKVADLLGAFGAVTSVTQDK